MNGQKAAVRGAGLVFGPIAAKHHVAFTKHGAVACDQLAFQDRELLVPVAAVPARCHARRHPADVKARSRRLITTPLQDVIARCQPIITDKGPEGGVVDVDDRAVVGVDRLPCGFRPG